MAGAASSAGSWVATLLGSLGSLFAEGGYTGSGHPSQPAGIVHKGEFVLPAHRVSAIGLDTLNLLHSGRINRLSAAEYRPNVGGIMSQIRSGGGFGGGGPSEVTAGLRGVKQAVNDLAEIHSRPIPVAFPVNEDTVHQLMNHGSAMRILGDAMLKNPSVMAPVIRRLK